MTKLFFAFLTSIFLTLGVMAQAVTAPTQSALTLGEVKKRVGGCGCTFSRNLSDEKKRRHFYVNNFEEAPLINLNGKDLKLTPVAKPAAKSEAPIKRKAGDHSWETYAAGTVKVRLDKVITKLCDTDEESCEVTYYDVTMTVQQGAKKTAIKLIGLCGC